jgi:radical SAM protein (TIGR01212 family)
VEAGVAFARRRYGATRLMAYVQAFSGTFAPPERQAALYDAILQAHPFEAFSVGTRPDCLPPATLNILSALRNRVDVWVELGVQTAHDRTLRRIGRGHDWACSRDAILRLARLDIRVVAHVILGLPGEAPPDWNATADALARLPLTGVKIHNLHVIRGTALAEEFERAPFPVPDEAEYAEGLIAFLRRLPPRVAILRINTDTPADRLLAPRWRMTKGQFRDHVVAEMRRRGARQADRLAQAEGGATP